MPSSYLNIILNAFSSQLIRSYYWCCCHCRYWCCFSYSMILAIMLLLATTAYFASCHSTPQFIFASCSCALLLLFLLLHYATAARTDSYLLFTCIILSYRILQILATVHSSYNITYLASYLALNILKSKFLESLYTHVIES